jgi:hypothetical protein
MEAQSFFRQEYLDGDDHDMVFCVVEDVLSFINEYHNSAVPIYCGFRVMFLPFTLLSLAYILYMLVVLRQGMHQTVIFDSLHRYSLLKCVARCPAKQLSKMEIIFECKVTLEREYFR